MLQHLNDVKLTATSFSFSLLTPTPSFPSLFASPAPPLVQRRLAAACRMGRGIMIRMCGSPSPAGSVSVTLGPSSATT